MSLDLRTKAPLLRVGDPESNVAICTLWFPVDQLMSAIDPKKYPWAVMGHLYNARQGLNYVAANLLANPQIRNLVIYGMGRPGINRSGTGEALYDFLTIGVERVSVVLPDGKPCWRVLRGEGHEHEAYLDAVTFPIDLLDKLRRHVAVHCADNGEVLKVTLWTIAAVAPHLHPKPALTKPIVVEVPEAANDAVWPAQGSTVVVRGRSVAEIWPKSLFEVMRHGKVRKSHYGEEPHMEVLNLVSVLEGELASPAGVFGQRDFGWMPGMYVPDRREEMPDFVRAGSSDLASEDALIDYTEKVLFGQSGIERDDEGEPQVGAVKYTYGDRIGWWFETNQLQGVIDKLASDEDAKSGVIDLWDSEKDLKMGGSPCLNHIWFRIADSRLWMTATIRSNDMYGAWPANAYSLRALQEYVLAGLNQRRFNLKRDQLRLGDLTIVSESAHVYEHSYNDAETVIAHEYEKAMATAYKRFDDPRGYYVIELGQSDGNASGWYDHIVAIRHTPDGQPAQRFVGETAKQVYAQIAHNRGISDTYHALDIGAELMKAEVSLKAALEYRQDDPLDSFRISWKGRWRVES